MVRVAVDEGGALLSRSLGQKSMSLLFAISFPIGCCFVLFHCNVPFVIRATAARPKLALLSTCTFSDSLSNIMGKSKPLVDYALSQINNRSDILPNHELVVKYVDSKCEAAEGAYVVSKALLLGEKMVGIFGDCCSAACKSISPVARSHNLLMVSVFCTASRLSDASVYPHFVRMSPTAAEQVVMTTQDLLQEFSIKALVWIIQDTEITVNIATSLKIQLDTIANPFLDSATYKISSRSGTIQQDIKDVVSALSVQRPRWVILSAYETMGALLYCEMYKHGLYSENVHFHIISPTHWWSEEWIASTVSSTDCSAHHLFMASYNTIGVSVASFRQTAQLHGISGEVISDVADRYQALCTDKGALGCHWAASYFYDAIWTWALTLHKWFLDGGNTTDLENPSERVLDDLYQKTLSQNYQGVTGFIKFFLNGDRAGLIDIKQTRYLDKLYVVGSWSQENGFQWRPSHHFEFPNDTVFFPSNRTGEENIPNDNQLDCGRGHYLDIYRNCKRCEAGSFSEGVNTPRCEPCPPGTSQLYTGMTQCVTCQPGTYAGGNSITCLPCDVGFYQDATGGSSCKACFPGTYNNRTGMDSCERCDIGEYNSEVNASFCTPCTITKTTIGTGEMVETACGCASGTYLNFKEDICVSCDGLEGLVCPGTFKRQLPFLKSGYWSNIHNANISEFRSIHVYSCRNPSACPGGSPEVELASAFPMCSKGMTGVACSRCQEGYYRRRTHCVLCGNTTNGIGPFILTIVACLTGALAFHLFVNSPLTRKAAVTVNLSMTVGMMVNFMQNLSILGEYNVQYPNYISFLFELASIFLLDVNYIRIGCVFGGAPLVEYSIKLLLPIFLIGVFLFDWLLCRLVTFWLVPWLSRVVTWNSRDPSMLPTNSEFSMQINGLGEAVDSHKDQIDDTTSKKILHSQKVTELIKDLRRNDRPPTHKQRRSSCGASLAASVDMIRLDRIPKRRRSSFAQRIGLGHQVKRDSIRGSSGGSTVVCNINRKELENILALPVSSMPEPLRTRSSVALDTNEYMASLFSWKSWIRSDTMSVNKIINSIGMLSLMLYISWVNNVCTVLQCYRHPSGDVAIVQYPEISCTSRLWKTVYLPLGIFGMVFYVFGIYIFFTYITLTAPHYFSRESFRTRYRFLVFRFRPDVYWYGVVLMARNCLLVMISSISPNDGHLQILLTVILLLFSVTLHIFFWPWLSVLNNVLDVVMLLALCLMCVAGSYFVTKVDDNKEVFGWTIIFCVVLCLVMVSFGVIFPAVTSISSKCRIDAEKKILGLAIDLRILGYGVSQMKKSTLAKELTEMPQADLIKLKSCLIMLKLEIVPPSTYLSALRKILHEEGSLDSRLDKHNFGKDMASSRRLIFRNSMVVRDGFNEDFQKEVTRFVRSWKLPTQNSQVDITIMPKFCPPDDAEARQIIEGDAANKKEIDSESSSGESSIPEDEGIVKTSKEAFATGANAPRAAGDTPITAPSSGIEDNKTEYSSTRFSDPLSMTILPGFQKKTWATETDI